MSASEAIVQTCGLRKIHARGTAAEVRALDDINLSVERGAYVAIVGESGSGKSTLMHVLGALDRATAGSVRVAGRDLASASRRELGRIRASEIGFVFQGFNLVPTLDARENVELAARYAGRSRARARADADRLLEEVGLADRRHHRPSQLSGGQQQRVAIARALVNEPSLLLADEPTGELDTKTSASVLELFERFHRERGQTIVMVTHNPAVWSRCETVVTLADGRIASIERRVDGATS